jgi:hypothetical protein
VLYDSSAQAESVGIGTDAEFGRELLPTRFEITAGFLFGEVAKAGSCGRDVEPRVALEALIRPALQRAPCIVGFSGGRDSSALLAVAADLASRERWAPPVPLSFRFRDPDTHESRWQERVVAHLGLADWIRPELSHELDFVGSVAAAGLRRYGVLYPPNVHLVAALAEYAPGGSVLTGAGGDDVFGGWSWHDVGDAFSGRRRVRLSDARRLGHALAPLRLRCEVARRQNPVTFPWLRSHMRQTVTRRVKDELAGAPRTWSARMSWLGSWRGWRAAAWSAARLGADRDVMVGSPLIDPRFLAALGRAGGRCGWGDRTATMRALFGDLLPDDVIARRSKATFSGPFFGPDTRAFAQRWDGLAGIDPDAVDARALRDTWTSRRPHFFSAMALQAAWLASEPTPGRAAQLA